MPIPADPPGPSSIPTFEVADDAEHRVLARWRRNVGAAVSLELAPPAPVSVRGLDVLSWNVAVGRGALDDLLRNLRAGAYGGAGIRAERPLVLLLQEAYRSDGTVPAHPLEPRHTGGDIAPAHPRDVVALAREHGLSLRYAPSMRNGAARSDRGNAVLCTAALGSAHAFALLYINQRRVTVAAELAGLQGLTLVSAHLDVSRRLGAADSASYRFGGARAEQAERLARAVVELDAPGGVLVGGDFNTPLGSRDPAFRALLRAGLVPGEREGAWDHTHHHPLGLRLMLDHVLFHPGGRIAAVRVARLDEVHGSDHHPLLARVELREG